MRYHTPRRDWALPGAQRPELSRIHPCPGVAGQAL
jgi:hypothetical protein